jgi:hypothetical protein
MDCWIDLVDVKVPLPTGGVQVGTTTTSTSMYPTKTPAEEDKVPQVMVFDVVMLRFGSEPMN